MRIDDLTCVLIQANHADCPRQPVFPQPASVSISKYFIYSNGTFTDLNLPIGYTPSLINDNGQIAGTASLGGGVVEGFIATRTSQVQEINSTSGPSALALLAGVLLIVRGRQKQHASKL